MFDTEEILEAVVEDTQRGGRFMMTEFYISKGIPAGTYCYGKLDDLGTEFLNANEERQVEMRKIPLPTKMKEPSLVSPLKHGTITFAEAQHIRSLVPRVISGRECAKRFGVSHITIQRIIDNKTYRPNRTRMGPAEIRLANKQRDRIQLEKEPNVEIQAR